jgi:hypothetical protein
MDPARSHKPKRQVRYLLLPPKGKDMFKKLPTESGEHLNHNDLSRNVYIKSRPGVWKVQISDLKKLRDWAFKNHIYMVNVSLAECEDLGTMSDRQFAEFMLLFVK